MFELSGKTALVTGGTRGIGLAIAKELKAEDCDVIVCSRSFGPMEGFTKINCDVLQKNSIESTLECLINDMDYEIDVLVNNVGGGGRWGKDEVENTELEIWEDVYTKNAFAAVRFTNYLLPYMRKKKWGRVVTISSIYGKEAGGRPWFNMAKSAEISLMKSLSKRKELVRDGITFNTVCPGHISVEGKPDETNLEDFPLGRMGTPEEVANVVAFLCSSKASLVNGSCITVDGGESFSF